MSRPRIPHPATMFFVLTLAVVFLSWICDVYGLSAVHPQTGEEIRVQSLLSPEGVRWLLRNVVTNFTGFAPLGLVIVAMSGIGVAQHSGFIDACIRRSTGLRQHPSRVILCVIGLGLLSNVAGDAGYILLLPVAATLFQSAGLHPVAGIITAYVSVACGYSANLFLGTIDPMLASVTLEAADAAGITPGGQAGPMCNYYFFFASTLLLAAVIYGVTRRSLLVKLGDYRGEVRCGGYKPLSRKERRALICALAVACIYAAVVLLATFAPWGILRGVDGGLIRSPFMEGILFLLSLGIGLTGMVYGFISGRYRTDRDVIDGLTQPLSLLAVYFVIVFFASQMFACFQYSRLDECLSIMSAEALLSVEAGRVGTLLLFILLTAAVNLIMVSATAKWSFMAFIFVPVLAALGISPDAVQCAFRIGDSATNALTPFMFYVPLVLACMQQYDRRSTYASLLGCTWRYSLAILLAWMLLFVVWRVAGLPLGL